MKGRRPTSSKVLDARGAFDKNPQRRRAEPEPQEGVGDPFDFMLDDEKAVWIELRDACGEEWLKVTDRVTLSSFCEIEAKRRRRDPEDPFTPIDRKEHSQISARLGLSPADRNRVRVTPKAQRDDLAEALGLA